MPDVFIPIDTTRYSDYHRDLVSKGLVNRVAMDYLDQHRKELTKAYKKPEKYKAEFEVTDEILAHLRDLADEKEIAFKEEEYNRSLPLIKLQIKALIARDLYEMGEYFYIINDVNESFQKALEIMNDEATYNRILRNS